MPPTARPGHAPVAFDELAWAEDLAHVSTAARAVAQQIRRRLERDGQAVGDLRACDAEGRDDTRLGGCANVYLPAPDAPWG